MKPSVGNRQRFTRELGELKRRIEVIAKGPADGHLRLRQDDCETLMYALDILAASQREKKRGHEHSN